MNADTVLMLGVVIAIFIGTLTYVGSVNPKAERHT